MTLRFSTTEGREPVGRFMPADPKLWLRGIAAADALAARFYRREVSPASCAAACRTLLRQDPLQLNALALYLDSLLAAAAKTTRQLAAEVHRSLRPVLKLVEGFSGTLDPKDENTIRFLGCHHALIAVTVETGLYAKALDMCLRHVRWDSQKPSDALAYIGNLHLVLGNLPEAEAFFSTPPVPMPYESAYGEALLRFLQGRHEEAAGILRQAVLTQPYVAEIILRRARGPVPAWRLPDNSALFYAALSYADTFLGSRIWRSGRGEAGLFLSWVYNSPAMLAERARALSILEGGPDSAAGGKAASAREKFFRFAHTPDRRLARKLVQPVAVDGRAVRPWLLPGALEAEAARPAGPLDGTGSRDGTGASGPAAAAPDGDGSPRDRRLRPSAQELDDAGAALADAEWLLADLGGPAGDLPALPPGPSGHAFTHAGPEGPFLDDGAPVPDGTDQAAQGPKGISHDWALGWEPWAPPAPSQEEPETDGGDCGDCEDCADYDQCSQSQECGSEECDECSECEIEGFCRSAPPPSKDPPFRH
ncbi:MAG: hypothetical protein LBW85_05845 [Deltaproteobacteria bacterium]|jgi:tetratricopeptide (TPR) repeat protein|nr:hypothetical protein [Deltaproteobacteria bacterium]